MRCIGSARKQAAALLWCLLVPSLACADLLIPSGGSVSLGGGTMAMGCTNVVINYRLEGHETVCLQSPSHGVQQLTGFNAASGDVVGLDDVLDTTLAHANLSDIGNYITSSISAAGTTLYFDPTGHGLQGSAIAVLQGVDTTVAQLVAEGGLGYAIEPITMTPGSSAPFTLTEVSRLGWGEGDNTLKILR